MADASYDSKVYITQGGSDLVAISGATITAESGSTVTLQGTTAITGTLTIGGIAQNGYTSKTVKVPLVAGAGVLSWANPEAVSIIITRIIVDVTTQSSGACTVDFGSTATTSTTSSDNLIDGLSVATAGVYDNISDIGTNGKSRQKIATGKWVTGTVASGSATGLVGSAYITYTPVTVTM